MAKKNQEYSNYYTPFMQPVPMHFDMLFRHYFNFLIRDLFQVFQFSGLPESVNGTFLKYCLFCNGKSVFFKSDDGELLALNGNYSDTPDVYYIPKKMLVTNPTLKRSYLMEREKECIVVYCTETDIYNQVSEFGGLYTLICRTATMLADSDLSINVAQKNKRLINVLAAEDQKTKDAIDVVVRKQYEGEPYAVVMKSLIDNVQSVPIAEKSSNNDIMQLIESHQYILSHFYESLGLQTHDQMKKERLITAEINDNDGIAKLNIDNILATINNGLQKVNAKYGTEITVRLNPILIEKTEPEEETDDSQSDGNQTDTTETTLEESQAAKPEEPEPTEETDDSQSDDNQTDTEPLEEESQADPEAWKNWRETAAQYPGVSKMPLAAAILGLDVTAEDNAEVEINIDTEGGVDDGNDNPV